jgi:large repetitive protein
MEAGMTTTPQLWKSLTQVNRTDAGFQLDGQIAGLLDGGYVVVWEDESKTYNPSGDAIVGQRYDGFGNKVGGEVKLSGFITGDQFSPAITALSNGNVAVAFGDQRSGDLDIYVRIFDPALQLVRVDPIDTDNTIQTVDPSITALAGGAYVVSYTLQKNSSENDFMARIVSPTGVVSAPIDVDNATFVQLSSEVATLSNGNFVVVYEGSHEFAPTQTDIDFRNLHRGRRAGNWS